MGISEKNIQTIEAHCNNMRRTILDMGKHAGSRGAHMGAALSVVEILSTLYFHTMNTADAGMASEDRDRFIMSKGHGCLGYYAVLMEAGLMDRSLAETFEDDGSLLLGHPVQNRENGIEFTNGSLGMGLGLGIGVAIAMKKKGISNRVFALLGDGECNEGSCWEAFMAAPNFHLDNLVAIIDQNGFQLTGPNKDIMYIGDMQARLAAFGWETRDVDGHDIGQLAGALDVRPEGRPLAVIAHTIKGKGFSFSENNNAWHHAVVTQKAYDQGIAELEGTSTKEVPQ